VSTILKRSLLATTAGLLTLGLVAFPGAPAHAEDMTTTISGVVALDDVPVSGVEVCASVSVYSQTAGAVQAAGPCVTTDGSGTYRIVFALSSASSEASVWADPGTTYADVFPQTIAGAAGRNRDGYFTINPGDSAIKNISVRSYAAEVVADPITGSRPVIAGKVKVGKRLTVQAGTWGPGSVQLSYQWLRNGKVIVGATNSTYKLVKADRRKKIQVKVTATADGRLPVAKESQKTKKVTGR
jgi:hypothetical protein